MQPHIGKTCAFVIGKHLTMNLFATTPGHRGVDLIQEALEKRLCIIALNGDTYTMIIDVVDDDIVILSDNRQHFCAFTHIAVNSVVMHSFLFPLRATKVIPAA